MLDAAAVVTPTKPCRILVVEDNFDAAQALAIVLERKNHEVETTRNGTEALVVASRFRPHAVLIDIGLPGLDGLHVARQLRSTHRALLIVAVTGRASREDRRLSQEAGCDYHLIKPLDFQLMNHILDQWQVGGGCDN